MPSPEAAKPAWKPGDPVLIDCKLSVRHGQVARLRERHVGQIAGRPYWTLDLKNGAIASEFEDSLAPAQETPSPARNENPPE